MTSSGLNMVLGSSMLIAAAFLLINQLFFWKGLKRYFVGKEEERHMSLFTNCVYWVGVSLMVFLLGVLGVGILTTV